VEISEFVGQNSIKKDLLIHLRKASDQIAPLEHTLFYGGPGLGKTAMSQALANELNVNLFQRTGQELTKDTLWEILEQIDYADILFIDEVHATPIRTLELLYGPLQTINDFNLNQIKVPQFYFERQYLKPFTFIGATTSAGMVAKPLRDRIILTYNFVPYPEKDLVKILVAKNCPISIARIIARRSRGTPRIALNFFIRIRNEAITTQGISRSICNSVFKRLNIDKKGLAQNDLLVLLYLKDNGITSESGLYKALNFDQTDYSEIIEPFLLSKQFIKITSKGRMITSKGVEYLEQS